MKRNWQDLKALFSLMGPIRYRLVFAAFFGVCGHVCAFLIPVLGVASVTTQTLYIKELILVAVLRGLFRYIEQALNHDVAFRVLATIRHHIFKALRVLIPGHFEEYGYGNLMTLITGDIELLEVFYAHTLSPIMIALVFNTGVGIYIVSQNLMIGIYVLVLYLIVGVIIPIVFSKRGVSDGKRYRVLSANLNAFTLENVFGMGDLLQFKKIQQRSDALASQSKRMGDTHNRLNKVNQVSRFISDFVVSSSLIGVLVISALTAVPMLDGVLYAVIAVSSFGPLLALSNLSGNLHHTLAAAKRVLGLLSTFEEQKDPKGSETPHYTSYRLEDVTLGYVNTPVLDHVSLEINQQGILGIKGKSGSGKSTLFNALMGFLKPMRGSLQFSGSNLENIDKHWLRKEIGYMEQDTVLFKMTVRENIQIGSWDATDSMIVEAAKRAQIHEFIESLPNGYDTVLDNSVSSGERQRIGLARLFLHDANLWLLDEPTSNLDSLNEASVLSSIHEMRDRKMIVISSHRDSTLELADELLDVCDGIVKKTEQT